MARRSLSFAVLLLVAAASAPAFERGALVVPTVDSLARDVAMLADPQLEGRGTGTPGGAHAAREIGLAFAAAGLAPGGDGQTFFQSFVVTTGTRIAPLSTFDLLAPDTARFEAGRDWRPHGGSLQGEVTNQVVFVGYGIATADGRWDDYRGVDVRGRIALALDGAPADFGARGTNRLDKLIAAKRAGASALLIAADRLPALDDTGARVDLVSAAVTRTTADRLLAPSGETTARLEASLAARRAPASFAVSGRSARIRVALETEDRRDVNVIGILRGRDPTLAHEAVVIGAHHDHVGVVGGQIHPGADDNASGTAVVLGLARAFAAAGGTPRTLVFALFGAEEVGLVGSAHYVGHPVVPLPRTVAMLNLDMVGRLRGNPLTIGGVDSGSGLRAIVNEASAATGVRITPRPDPHSPSDHLSFYRAGTPVLFFHTGTHADYHKPTDTADRIDNDGLGRVAAMTAAVIERLAAAPAPGYVKLTPPARRERERARRPAERSGARGERPGAQDARPGGGFLGIAGDARGSDGVHLREVVPGSAAERAGVRRGDVLVRVGGELVNGIEDVRRLLEAKKPGDTVELVYLRDGEDRTASAALDARP